MRELNDSENGLKTGVAFNHCGTLCNVEIRALEASSDWVWVLRPLLTV